LVDKIYWKVWYCFEQHDIDIPNSTLITHHDLSRHQKDNVITKHHFRLNIFFVTMNKQLEELNDMFSKQTMKLYLSNALIPKYTYK